MTTLTLIDSGVRPIDSDQSAITLSSSGSSLANMILVAKLVGDAASMDPSIAGQACYLSDVDEITIVYNSFSFSGENLDLYYEVYEDSDADITVQHVSVDGSALGDGGAQSITAVNSIAEAWLLPTGRTNGNTTSSYNTHAYWAPKLTDVDEITVMGASGCGAPEGTMRMQVVEGSDFSVQHEESGTLDATTVDTDITSAVSDVGATFLIGWWDYGSACRASEINWDDTTFYLSMLDTDTARLVHASASSTTPRVQFQVIELTGGGQVADPLEALADADGSDTGESLGGETIDTDATFIISGCVMQGYPGGAQSANTDFDMEDILTNPQIDSSTTYNISRLGTNGAVNVGLFAVEIKASGGTSVTYDLTSPDFGIDPNAMTWAGNFSATLSAPDFGIDPNVPDFAENATYNVSAPSFSFTAQALTWALNAVYNLSAPAFSFTALALDYLSGLVYSLSSASFTFTAQALTWAMHAAYTLTSASFNFAGLALTYAEGAVAAVWTRAVVVPVMTVRNVIRAVVYSPSDDDDE